MRPLASLVPWLLGGLLSTSPRARQEPPTDWIDPATGHRVIRLSTEPGSATLYFHDNAYSPRGDRFVFNSPSGIVLVDLTTLGTGTAPRVELAVPRAGGTYMARRSREVYFTRGGGRGGGGGGAPAEVFAYDYDTKATRRVPYATRTLINADETTTVGTVNAEDPTGRTPRPAYREPRPQLERMFPGKRMDELTPAERYAVTKEDGLARRALNPDGMAFVFTDLKTGAARTVGYQYAWLNHMQFSPTDPTLLLYCHEGTWHEVDRIWTIRTDGSGMTLRHKRTMDMEIAGHEWWSHDGKTIWFDLQTPRSQVFWIAGVNVETGKETRYRVERDAWSVHYNASRDDSLFMGDGGDETQVAFAPDGRWINLFAVQPDGTLRREKLVSMARHDYVTGRGGVEPNGSITPDKRWVIFTGNFHGARHVYAVEIARSRPPAQPARPTPPTRDPRTPGYVTARELPDGAVPPSDADGNFVVGPTHRPAPETAAQDGVPRGTVHTFTMRSADSRLFPGIARDSGTFGTPDPGDPARLVVTTSRAAPWTRRVAVYVPAGYVPGTVAPLLVGADGPDTTLFRALDALIARRRVPPVVAVSIANGGGDAQGSERGLEYDTMSGRYAEFVETEVLPRVARQYGVTLTRDPEGRATMGCSSGAAAAFTMAWYHPEWYRRVLSYSGTFVNQQWPRSAETPHGAWALHERLIPASPRKPIRVWMEVGDRDLLNPNVMRDGMHDWVVANERMAAALAAKGYPYQFVFARDAGHCDRAVKQQTLPAALEWLWRGYRARAPRPAARPAREGWVVTADSARLHYRVVGRGADTIIAVHGGPGVDLESIAGDFAPLAERHTVIFYDQRGAGRSTLPRDTTSLTAERQVEDLDAVRRHFGLARATLVAHSYGPLLAASYALAHPDAVRRMVFFGPVPPRRGDFWQRFAANVRPRVDSAAGARMAAAQRRLADSAASPEETRSACRAYWAEALRPRLAEPERTLGLLRSDLCGSDPAGIRYGLAVTNRVVMASYGDWDLTPRLRGLAVPTLVVHGEAEAIPMDLAEEWTRAMPNARLLRVPRAAHFAYAERPELVWPAVERFLRGPAAAARSPRAARAARRAPAR